MSSGVQVPKIAAIIVTDGEGKRIAAKYYGGPAMGPVDPLSSSKPSSTTPSSDKSSSSPSSSSPSSTNNNTNTTDLSDPKNQSAFEKKIFQKTARTNARVDAEMLLFEKYLLVYRFHNDVFIYILGDVEENELVLLSILSALEESLNMLLRNTINKKSLLDNFDLLLLTIDEIIDDGNLLELDSSNLLSRVAMKMGGGSNEPLPLSEQTFTQALQTAKDQLVKSFR